MICLSVCREFLNGSLKNFIDLLKGTLQELTYFLRGFIDLLHGVLEDFTYFLKGFDGAAQMPP